MHSIPQRHLKVLQPDGPADAPAALPVPPAPKFDLFRLHLFLTVAHFGSLTAAGDVLGLPQPIVSRHLARLEKEFGGRLFERNGRGVVLSELGRKLHPGIERLLQNAADLAREIDDVDKEPAGEVRVGLPASLRGFLTVPLFFKLKERFPQVRLSLQEGSSRQIEHWLGSGEIDLGLTHRYGRYSDQHADKLLALDLYLIGPKGDSVTRHDCVDFIALAGLPLILPQSPSEFRSKLDQVARHHHIKLDVVMEAEFGQIHRDLVKLGGGYGMSTWHMISEYVHNGDLQASRIVNPVVRREIAIGYAAGKSTGQATRAVASVVKDIMASDAVAKAVQRELSP